MTRMDFAFQPDLADLSFRDWLQAIDDLAEEHGYFEPVGPDHSATLIDAGHRLIVTFQTTDDARSAASGHVPLGWRYAASRGWSALSLMSHATTWFRDPAVYGYFDRLIDDGFFDEFSSVLFYGVGPSGYAAAAYSVASPGAQIVAIRPQATLSPALAGWDTRFIKERRRDFTSRYGYAPDMIEGCGQAAVIYNPANALDACHAGLFRRDQTLLLQARGLGPTPEIDLAGMGALDPILDHAMNGTLTPTTYFEALRARRGHGPYLRRLVRRTDAAKRPALAAAVCRAAHRRGLRHAIFDRIDTMATTTD